MRWGQYKNSYSIALMDLDDNVLLVMYTPPLRSSLPPSSNVLTVRSQCFLASEPSSGQCSLWLAPPAFSRMACTVSISARSAPTEVISLKKTHDRLFHHLPLLPMTVTAKGSFSSRCVTVDWYDISSTECISLEHLIGLALLARISEQGRSHD